VTDWKFNIGPKYPNFAGRRCHARFHRKKLKLPDSNPTGVEGGSIDVNGMGNC